MLFVPVRMKMKLPLQQTNVVVEKLTFSGKETFVQNDAIVCDSVEGVLQSVTELCISEDSNKKPATEAMPNSVPEQVEIINEVAEAKPNSVPEQREITNEVSTTDVDVFGVTAGNNVETAVVVINEDSFLERFRNVWTDMKLFLLHKKHLNPT